MNTQHLKSYYPYSTAFVRIQTRCSNPSTPASAQRAPRLSLAINFARDFLFVRLGVRAGYGNKLQLVWGHFCTIHQVGWPSSAARLQAPSLRLAVANNLSRCVGISVLFTIRYSLFTIIFNSRTLAFLFYLIIFMLNLNFPAFCKVQEAGFFCADLRGCGGFQLAFTLV